MLRKIIILALTATLFTTAFATPIDMPTALAKARQFAESKGMAMQLDESRARKAPGMKNAVEETPYYIFNAANDKGFVIISGDDLMPSVLGYSDSGHIDTDDLPDGLRLLLEAYQETASQSSLMADSQPEIAARQGIRRSMSAAKYPIKPFLTKAWGHRTPFNNHNPVHNDTITLTGCTIVAVSEVLGYFEYPKTLGSVSGYTTETSKIVVPALPSITFDWYNMLPNYNRVPSYDSIQAAAVADLTRYVGQVMRADYGTKSTPGYSGYMPRTLRAFGYNATNLIPITDKSMHEWDEIIYNDLKNKRPVILAANNVTNNLAGHAFIIDGCDEDDLYHIDWGWSANANGYFRMSNLSPYNNSNSYTYERNLSVIYNIEPKSTYVADTDVPPYTNLQTTSLTVDMEDIIITRVNRTSNALSFKDGIALVGHDNEIMRILHWDSITYQPGKALTKTWNVLDLSGVKNGKYRIYPVSQLVKGDGIWHFDDCNSTNAFAEIEVVNGQFTLTEGPALVYNSFEPSEDLKFVLGAARHMTLNLTNNTMDRLDKRLYLYEDSTAIDITHAVIQPNTTGDAIFTYFPQTSGTHTLRLYTDTIKPNLQPIMEKEITVAKAVGNTLKVISAQVDNLSSGHLYGNSLRIIFCVKNVGSHDYNDFIRQLIRLESWDRTKKMLVHIPAGDSIFINVEYDDLAYDFDHIFYLYYKTSSTLDPHVFTKSLWARTFQPRQGICWWDDKGKLHAKAPSTSKFTMPEDAVALDVSAQVKIPNSIVPNKNPNTLYYVRKNYDTLEGHNVIFKNKADSINFVDEYSCIVPLDFHANYVGYKRTFEKGFTGKRNGNNWSTIVLPFDVQKVYNIADECEIDWFRNDDETDKNFWLRQYYGQEGYTTYFEDAQAMKAYTPYIITVPSDYKGEEYSLVGKPLVFSADDVDMGPGKPIADTRNFDFQGSLYGTDTFGGYIYMLDEEDSGNTFVYTKGASKVKPFRAYFTSETEPEEGSILYVAARYTHATETDGIDTIDSNLPTSADIYTLSGVKVSANGQSVQQVLSTLPQGVYIVGGKKVVKR